MYLCARMNICCVSADKFNKGFLRSIIFILWTCRVHTFIQKCMFVSVWMFGCSLVPVCMVEGLRLSLKPYSGKVGSPPPGHEYTVVSELQ